MKDQSSDPDFERRAWLSVVWQDLTDPVLAIVNYQEIIVEEAERFGLTDCQADLDRVLVAARALNELVEGLRGPMTKAGAENNLAGFQATLRHDLRTPLNAIIGYSEMVLEYVEDDARTDMLRADIARLLAEARQLLDRVDAIVDFERAGANTAIGAGAGDGAQAAIRELLQTLRPRRESEIRKESGRILAVDDNKSNRDLLKRRLTHEGHSVVVCESGRRALAILETQSFDLILLDLLMPDMNGIEVLDRLKNDVQWHQIPVIMISGLQETDAAIRCIEAGAEDYLTKPFNLVLLRARINACLERKHWREREREYLKRLQEEKDRSDALIHNILPAPIVLRLNDGETIIADRFESASILFADIVDFTPAAATMHPAHLVERLDKVFSEFDTLALNLGVEKIKTIGDAYMAAAGLPEPRTDHAEAIVNFALGIISALGRVNASYDQQFQVRIGIHSGPVVAGIIGRNKFIYDVWGDTVNIASRLESQGLPNQIQVSQAVQEALSHRFVFVRRGTIVLKGRGDAATFLLSGDPPA
jgi:adenylate cyclase